MHARTSLGVDRWKVRVCQWQPFRASDDTRWCHAHTISVQQYVHISRSRPRSLVGGAKKCTDATLYDISIALASSLTTAERANGQVFPTVSRIREVSEAIALATIKSTMKQGLATKVKEGEDIEVLLDRKTYYPTYVPLGMSPYR